jgi:uncharacterized protein (DUF849 family)
MPDHPGAQIVSQIHRRPVRWQRKCGVSFMLQACLNGGRRPDFHPALPLSADQLAADARAVVAAGAEQIHLHVRGADGKESLQPDDVARTLDALRTAVPGVPLGLSTGWWISPKGRARQDHIRAWQALPDYVSINLIEDDSAEMIELALSKGIGVEAGIWSPADAEKFVVHPAARRCLRVLIELNEQDLSAGLEAYRDVMAILDRAGIRLPRLLHGLDATVWDFYREALQQGLDARIGLEDGKHLPDGTVAGGNAALIRAARALAT